MYIESTSIAENPFLANRLIKLCPVYWLNPYTHSIYVDGNVELTGLVSNLFDVAMGNPMYNLAVFAHPDRCCIYEELVECMKRCPPSVIKEQMLKYAIDGFPMNWGLSWNNVLIRRHTVEIHQLGCMWMYELYVRAKRDQTSFMYCLWKLDLRKSTFIMPLRRRDDGDHPDKKQADGSYGYLSNMNLYVRRPKGGKHRK